MLYLLKGERFKIKKNIMSRIMSIVYLLSIGLYTLQFISSYKNVNLHELPENSVINMFSFIFGDLSRYGNEIKSTLMILGFIAVTGFVSALFIIPIFTSIFITNEYSARSIQQLVCKGTSRPKIVLSKCFSIIEFIIILSIGVNIIGYVITLLMCGKGNVSYFINAILIFALKMILVNITLIVLCTFVSFLIKNGDAAMPVNFIVVISLCGGLFNSIFSNKVLQPIIFNLTLCAIFLLGTIYIFNTSDI